MNRSQLETLVLRAIDRLRARDGQEDDIIEFKREWPSADKARQLAGGANRARGVDVIYVIGVDETDGAVYAVGNLDPATWFAQIESAFDEVAPELENHIVVQVGNNQTVVALQFRTDRPPYVVKVANGGKTEREVPLRVGTRTRSANRHEILRFLVPEVRVPFVSPITASLTLGRPDFAGNDSDELGITLLTELYFEYVGAAGALIPKHGISARLIGGTVNVVADLPYYHSATTVISSHGLSRRADGVELNGSGSLHLNPIWRIKRADSGKFAEVNEWTVQLEFAVSGSDRFARADLRLGQRFSETDHALASQISNEDSLRYSWRLLDGS